MHVATIPGGTGRRIERIGNDPAIPGIRRIEWHEASAPDGRFLRLPLPNVVCTLNIGVVGRYRLNTDGAWRAFPRVAFRGVSRAPSEGEDPAAGAIGYITVLIAPWAMRLYSGISGAHLADRIVDGTCFGPEWRQLWETLATEMDPLSRLNVVSQWLATRVAMATWSARTAAVVDAVAAAQSVASIARSASLSTRRVHQLCVQETGHSPTTYRQIARFARLAQALHHDGNAQRWSQHVREYADDSHAIREFRRLARVTPRDYAAHRRAVARTYSIVPQ